MKLLSAIALMSLLPMAAFGGTTCYKATSNVPDKVPATLCLEGIVESNTGRDLVVVSLNKSFPADLMITEFSRHNEDRINFSAKGVIANINEGTCGYSFSANVIVKSEIAYGLINPKVLKITVETSEETDNCHSYPQEEVITYELVK